MAFRRGKSTKRGRDGDEAAASASDDEDSFANIAPEVEADSAQAAELAEKFRSRQAKFEAERDLMRLRDRHWSGERLIEEARLPEDWWEHPDADPFAVLGLMPGSPLSQAASARRRVAMECHPDRLPEGADGDMALRRMVAANSAYDRLRRAMHPAP